MGERLGQDSQPISEMSADQSTARRETARSHFVRLLESDPLSFDHHRRREWFTEVVSSAQLLVTLIDDAALRDELNREASALQIQMLALAGPLAEDEATWGILIGNARDMMKRALAGPDRPEDAT